MQPSTSRSCCGNLCTEFAAATFGSWLTCRALLGFRRAHRDLRAALAILSMAAASRPEAFTQQHVEDLLRYG